MSEQRYLMYCLNCSAVFFIRDDENEMTPDCPICGHSKWKAINRKEDEEEVFSVQAAFRCPDYNS